MLVKHVAALMAVAIAVAAASSAPATAQDDTVDRDRLRKLLRLPTVLHMGWYYSLGSDGVARAGGYDAARDDVATLHAAASADASNADRWTELGAAYRRMDDDARAREALDRAVELLREQGAEQADDGVTLASLGLALVAVGDVGGGEEVIQRAGRAPRNPWAGMAASGDLAMMRGIAQLAERPFASPDAATRWFRRRGDRAPHLDDGVLDLAESRYTAGIANAEKQAATGAGVASLYLSRRFVRGIRLAKLPPDASPQARSLLRSKAESDERQALEKLPADPFALTLLVLDDAMEPVPNTGGRHVVRPFATLSDVAQAKVEAGMSRLRKMAGSSASNARRSARALQGVACIHWFVWKDDARTEAYLRRSIATDPSETHSWDVLTFVLARSRRWDDIVAIGEEWLEHGDTARKHMLIATALSAERRAVDAEKEWRTALALDPEDPRASLGVAAFVLRGADDEAAVKEAIALVRAAREALASSRTSPGDEAAVLCDLTEAITLGLAGDIAGAEKTASRALGTKGAPQAREILKAIGR